MHSRSSGPLTTLLMLIPLIAVPLLAVFGVPRFAPLSASNSVDDDLPPIEIISDTNIDERASAHEHTSKARTAAIPTAGVANAPHVRAVSNSSHPNTLNHPPDEADHRQHPQQRRLDRRSSSQWNPPSNTLGQWEPNYEETGAATKSIPLSKSGEAFASLETSEQSQRPGGTSDSDHAKLARDMSLPDEPVLPPEASQNFHRDEAAIEGSLDTVASPFKPIDEISPASKHSHFNQQEAGSGNDPNTLSPKPLTWQMAIRKLNELGIRDYQLQPGATADAFHFSCSFADARLSRLTHRFEAEAIQPIQAVENVLSQIEKWQSRHRRGSRRHQRDRNKTVNVSRR